MKALILSRITGEDPRRMLLVMSLHHHQLSASEFVALMSPSSLRKNIRMQLSSYKVSDTLRNNVLSMYFLIYRKIQEKKGSKHSIVNN